MAAVVTIFSIAALYTRIRLNATDQAIRVARNGAPSLQNLSQARVQLRLMRAAAEKTIETEDETAHERLADARRVLDRVMAELGKLPTYPGEAALQEDYRRARADLEHAQLRRHDLDAPLDALDARVDALYNLNDANLQKDATEIFIIERSADALVYHLEIACVILSVVVTLVLLRFIRRYFAMALLEHRARELEYFAVQVGHDIFNPLTPIHAAFSFIRTEGGSERVCRLATRGLRNVERIRRAAEALQAFAHAGDPPAAGAVASLRSCVESARTVFPAGQPLSIEPFDDRPILAGAHSLDGLLRIFLREAARETATAVSLRVGNDRDLARVELHLPRQPGGAQPPARELFAPRIRGPLSGYPGIELEMVAARRIVEAHGGRVGVDDGPSDRLLWFTLPTI